MPLVFYSRPIMPLPSPNGEHQEQPSKRGSHEQQENVALINCCQSNCRQCKSDRIAFALW